MGPIGEDNLGERARLQLETARNDPRIESRDGAMVADMLHAFEEAERLRMLTILGLNEVSEALERMEVRYRVKHDDPALDPLIRGPLQAAYERGELAKAELANETPHLNAMTLVSFVGALDACVEKLVPVANEIYIKGFLESKMPEHDDPQIQALWSQFSGERRAEMITAIAAAVAKTRDIGERLGKLGAKRYEAELAKVNLQTLSDRPIPDDLDTALKEVGVLRHALLHRGGRVNEWDLDRATSLRARYDVGDFLRIKNDDYRTYSAALRAYAFDIVRRPFRGLMEDHIDFDRWRDYRSPFA